MPPFFNVWESHLYKDMIATKIKRKKHEILQESFVLFFVFFRYKTKTANHLVCGLDVSDMIRTRDLLIRSQTLYPAELHSHIRFEQNIYYSMRNEMSITFLKNFKKFG